MLSQTWLLPCEITYRAYCCGGGGGGGGNLKTVTFDYRMSSFNLRIFNKTHLVDNFKFYQPFTSLQREHIFMSTFYQHIERVRTCAESSFVVIDRSTSFFFSAILIELRHSTNT